MRWICLNAVLRPQGIEGVHLVGAGIILEGTSFKGQNEKGIRVAEDWVAFLTVDRTNISHSSCNYYCFVKT
jgi:hypothetical protein